MGTIIYTTDKAPGAVLQDELCGEAEAIRMFTICGDSAAVALRVDLAKASDRYRDHILRTYDLPQNATCAVVGVIVKHSGLNGRGARSVSIKVMGEECGPYYTGGATKQLLSILSPLRPGASPFAEDWRAKAWPTA